MTGYIAYVHYLMDDRREIVPIKDIKNFAPKSKTDFEKRKIYKVLWPKEGEDHKQVREYYEATILALGDEKEQFQGKRFTTVPRNILLTASESEDIPYKKTTEYSQINECEIKSLVATRISEKNKKRCLRQEESFDELSTDDELVSKKDSLTQMKNIQENFNAKKRKFRTKVAELEQDNKDLKGQLAIEQEGNGTARFTALEQENEDLRRKLAIEQDRSANLIDLNIKLQNNYFTKLETRINERSLQSPRRDSADCHQLADIGNGVFVNPHGLARVKTHVNKSLMVKDLASLIWTDDDLRNKSVTGRKCPTVEGCPKPPLTPQKLVALNDAFRKILMERDIHPQVIEKEMTLVNKYIREKISDIQKKYKKGMAQNVSTSLNTSEVSEHCATSCVSPVPTSPQITSETTQPVETLIAAGHATPLPNL